MYNIESIGITALKKAQKVIEALGEDGRRKVRSNIHGEISLLADIEAEKAVISTLKEQSLSIKIISEEHNIVEFGANPKFLGILDGIDGTKEYEREGENKRYGTMFAIFAGTNPNYSDYIFSGIMEHPTKRLFFASKHNGAFVIKDNSKSKIRASNKKELDNKTKIYYHKGIEKTFSLNNNYKSLLSKLKRFNLMDMYAAETKYVDIASGKADLALEFTRKRNLEIAVGYGLIKEAGGVLYDVKGKDIGQYEYLEFYQDKHVLLIVASTKELAKDIIKNL